MLAFPSAQPCRPASPNRVRQRALARAICTALASAALACSALTAAPAQAQQSLPSLGEIDGLSVGEERRLGDRIAQQLYRDPDYIDDPVLQEYVDDIWQALMQAARDKGALGDALEEQFAWAVLLGKSRTVNAFALPGGYFGLHLGLINAVGSKDELASVMAHELSHVTQRHISRMVAQNARQTPILIASMILGALAASQSPEAAQALMAGGQALTMENTLGFSRNMEQEADRIGLSLMRQASFNPHGFVLMFDKLHQANRFNDNGAYPYLRTHPLTSQRMSDMQARMPESRQHASAIALLPEHAIIVARSRVLSRDDVNLLRQNMQLAAQIHERMQKQTVAADSATPSPEQAQAQAQAIGQLYGGVLAAVQSREFAKARAWLASLHQLAKADKAASRLAQLLEAEAALAANDAQWITAAQAGISQTSERKRPELLALAQAALQTGANRAAIAGDLQTWLVDHASDATAWSALGQLWHAEKQPLRAIRAEAEAQAARLDYAAAVDRLKAAQNMVRELGTQADHVEASIITSRLQALEDLQKIRTQEERKEKRH